MGLSKQDHLDPAKGPKRILALDGGGIRGILTLQFLKTIETLVKQRLGDEALLCDYFDLIGGTSTGSIIAAGLACGMTVEALQELYRNIGASVFQPGGLAKFLPKALQGKFAPKFPADPLQRELDKQLGADTTLDSDRIRTGLMIMTKRLDTGSPWPLNNGERGKYAAQDGALRLTQIVRRSGPAAADARGAAGPRLLLADGQGAAAHHLGWYRPLPAIAPDDDDRRRPGCLAGARRLAVAHGRL